MGTLDRHRSATTGKAELGAEKLVYSHPTPGFVANKQLTRQAHFLPNKTKGLRDDQCRKTHISPRIWIAFRVPPGMETPLLGAGNLNAGS
jgi:hypothetical protein